MVRQGSWGAHSLPGMLCCSLPSLPTSVPLTKVKVEKCQMSSLYAWPRDTSSLIHGLELQSSRAPLWAWGTKGILDRQRSHPSLTSTSHICSKAHCPTAPEAPEAGKAALAGGWGDRSISPPAGQFQNQLITLPPQQQTNCTFKEIRGMYAIN